MYTALGFFAGFLTSSILLLSIIWYRVPDPTNYEGCDPDED